MGVGGFPHSQAVIDALDRGVLVADGHGTVTAANALALELCLDSPVGSTVDELTVADGVDVEVVPLPDGGSVVLLAPAPPERLALNGLLARIPASVVRVGADLRVTHVSNLWLQATGLTRDDVIGGHLHGFGFSTRVSTEVLPLVDRVLASGRRESVELLVPTTVGLRWVDFTFVAERDRAGEVTHAVGVSTDVTARKTRELSLTKEAATDPLTGLLNRSGLNAELRERSDQPDWSEHALLLLDLDDFKQVNDLHGHLVGDDVLAEVARRIHRVVGDEDAVARIGGDEFVVLARNDEAPALAAALQTAFGEPVVTEAVSLRIRLSIGVASPDPDGDATDLFHRADEAMYRAKRTRDGTAFDG